jgi:hypothetical protein
MYQGYMKRGLSLMIEFFGILALAALTNVGQLVILALIVWLYSFFDSYNLRAQTDEEAEKNPDAYILGILNGNRKDAFGAKEKSSRIIGWALILVGILILYNMTSWYLGDLMSDWLYNVLYAYLPRMLISALIIGLGVWFIHGGKRKKEEPAEDFAAYAPEREEGEQKDGGIHELQIHGSDCGEK